MGKISDFSGNFQETSLFFMGHFSDKKKTAILKA